MAVWLAGRIRRWFRKRVGGRRRGRRTHVRLRWDGKGGAARLNAGIAAYQRAKNSGERLSWFAQEALEVPAYEDRALRGERSPHRFRWRGRWYRVVEVAASWEDGRQPTPARPMWGRAFFNVITEQRGLFQIYYERSASRRTGNGRWILYRRTEIRPVAGIEEALKKRPPVRTDKNGQNG